VQDRANKRHIFASSICIGSAFVFPRLLEDRDVDIDNRKLEENGSQAYIPEGTFSIVISTPLFTDI